MNDLLQWIRQTGLEHILWVTDVDETLLEKSSDPNDVTPVSGLEADCEELDRNTGGGFWVITGREMTWLNEVFPGGRIRASCEYHSLFRAAPNREPMILNPVPAWHLIDRELEQLVAQHEGLLLRKKDFMRSLHYIAVPEDKRDEIKAQIEPKLRLLLDRHNEATGQSLGITDGGKVFDMGPSDSDKGHALNDILQHAQLLAFRNLVPIYFGDSPGDIPGAEAAHDNGGVFVMVGDDERLAEHADFKLKDPSEYRDFIKKINQLAPQPDTCARPRPHH